MSATDYDWLVLEPDEEIIWSGEPTLLGYVGGLVIGFVMIPLAGIGLVIIASTYLQAKNTAYVITTDSVYKKTGILSRRITDIGHENIQDTGYSQSIVGRHFDFGIIQISTAGGSGIEMALTYVSEPLEVQSQLDAVAATAPSEDESTDRSRQETVQIDDTTLEELVEEMQATRKALESIERRLTDE